MKHLYLLIALCSFGILTAQIPTNYYQSATGTGYTLKTQLYNIIKDHTVVTYTPGLWDLFKTSDVDIFYENDGSVLDMYSENPKDKDPYNFAFTTNQCGSGGQNIEGDCYNREHMIPQSVFNSNSPMVSDAHHITPTDKTVNALRGNFPHGNVNTSSKTTLNGSKLGTSNVPNYTGTVFEPIDEFKGDIARIYFYFATRYQDQIAGWNYGMFNNTSDQVFTDGFLNMLYEWHKMDPVSQKEITRNNEIYKVQNNRNPFIDHPEWVESIWSSKLSTEKIEMPSASIAIYPNPSKDSKINIDSTEDVQNIEIISIEGKLYQTIQKPMQNPRHIYIDHLPHGTFLFKIQTQNSTEVKKVIIH